MNQGSPGDSASHVAWDWVAKRTREFTFWKGDIQFHPRGKRCQEMYQGVILKRQPKVYAQSGVPRTTLHSLITRWTEQIDEEAECARVALRQLARKGKSCVDINAFARASPDQAAQQILFPRIVHR